VRHGRLAAAGTIPPNAHPRPYVDALIATAETIFPWSEPTGAPMGAASAEEMECILRWMDSPGTRPVQVEGVWTSPVHGAERLRAWIDNAYADLEPGERSTGRPLR
jgi:DNA polymerase III subunit epsilon